MVVQVRSGATCSVAISQVNEMSDHKNDCSTTTANLPTWTGTITKTLHGVPEGAFDLYPLQSTALHR